jgi:hypothetical protein
MANTCNANIIPSKLPKLFTKTEINKSKISPLCYCIKVTCSVISLIFGHGFGAHITTTVHLPTHIASHVTRWRRQLGRCVEGPLNDYVKRLNDTMCTTPSAWRDAYPGTLFFTASKNESGSTAFWWFQKMTVCILSHTDKFKIFDAVKSGRNLEIFRRNPIPPSSRSKELACFSD